MSCIAPPPINHISYRELNYPPDTYHLPLLIVLVVHPHLGVWFFFKANPCVVPLLNEYAPVMLFSFSNMSPLRVEIPSQVQIYKVRA